MTMQKPNAMFQTDDSVAVCGEIDGHWYAFPEAKVTDVVWCEKGKVLYWRDQQELSPVTGWYYEIDKLREQLVAETSLRPSEEKDNAYRDMHFDDVPLVRRRGRRRSGDEGVED